MLIEQENFLTNIECECLIDIFHEYSNLVKIYRNTNVLEFDYMFFYCEDESTNNILKNIRSKVEHHIKQIDYNAFSNYLQIVEWPQGSFQDLHYDFNYHYYTSIIYLNHDYEGGYTRVSNSNILPRKGKIATFKGNETLHGVAPVVSGTRYTVPVWYKSLGDIAQR